MAKNNIVTLHRLELKRKNVSVYSYANVKRPDIDLDIHCQCLMSVTITGMVGFSHAVRA